MVLEEMYTLPRSRPRIITLLAQSKRMNYYEGIYSHGGTLVVELHRDYRRRTYWQPLKRYLRRMSLTAIFLAVMASVAIAGVTVASAFFVN